MLSLVLVLLGLLLPTQLGLHFWPPSSYVYGLRVDYLSPTIYLTDLLLLFFLIANLPYLIRILRSNLPSFLILLLLIILNTYFSTHPLISAISWFRLLLLFNLAHFLSHLPPTILRHFLTSLLISTLVICSLAIFQVSTGSSLNYLAYYLGERRFTLSTPGIARISILGRQFLRPYSTFSHPNSLAGYLLLIFVLFRFLRYKLPFQLLTQLIICLVLFLTVSRSAIFALFVAVLFRHSTKLIYASFLISLLFLFLQLFPLSVLSSIQSLTDRFFLATDALRLISHRLLTGVGLSSFTSAQGIFHLGIKNAFIYLQPVHHLFLLLTAETGLLGLTILIVLINHLRSLPHRSTLLVIILSLVLLTGALDHYWLTLPQNRLLLAVSLGLVFHPQSSKLFI